MQPTLGETIYRDFTTRSPITGDGSDADSLPTVEVFENGTDTPILTPTVVKRTGKTGNYYVAIAVTTGNGFEAGKSYNVVATATVDGYTDKGVVSSFQARAYNVDAVNLGYAGGVAVTNYDATLSAYSNATTVTFPTTFSNGDSVSNTLDAYKGMLFVPVGGTGGRQAAQLITGFSTGRVATLSPGLPLACGNDTTFILAPWGLVPWNSAWDAEVESEATDALNAYDPPTNAEMTARTLATASYATATNQATAITALNTIDGIVDAIVLVTNKLDTMLENIGGQRFTEHALSNVDVGSGGSSGGGETDWTNNQNLEIRTVLGVTGTGSPDSTPSAGALKDIQDTLALIKVKTDEIKANAAEAGDAMALTSDAIEDVHDTVWNLADAVEDGATTMEVMRAIASLLGGSWEESSPDTVTFSAFRNSGTPRFSITAGPGRQDATYIE